MLRTSCAIAGMVLVIDVSAITILGTDWEATDGLGTIYKGECLQFHLITLGLHVVINVLRTALFGAAYPCMQLIAAPTRKEVDEAHKQRCGLDIGAPTFHHLTHISRHHLMIMIIPTISVPLH